MNLISETSAYNRGDVYYNTNNTVSGTGSITTEKKTVDKEKPSGVIKDTVTLSKEVEQARTREALGLKPTGKLKLGDFEQVAKAQEDVVQTKLAARIKELGIDPAQTVTLALDGESNITITEKFKGKKDLEKKLNEDPSFALAFKQLSTNNEILDYTKTLQKSSVSLASYMNPKTDWNDIMSLASRFEGLKSSKPTLESLIKLSKATEPYSFTHDPKAVNPEI